MKPTRLTEAESIIKRLLATVPVFGNLAAAVGNDGIWCYLKPAPAKLPKLKDDDAQYCHLKVFTIEVLKGVRAAAVDDAAGNDGEAPLFLVHVSEFWWSKMTEQEREAGLFEELMKMRAPVNADGDFVAKLAKPTIRTFEDTMDRYGRWWETMQTRVANEIAVAAEEQARRERGEPAKPAKLPPPRVVAALAISAGEVEAQERAERSQVNGISVADLPIGDELGSAA